MALTAEGIAHFLRIVVNLQSFPLFCCYLLLVPFSSIWHRYTSPLGLRPILVAFNFTCSLISLYTLVGFSYAMYDSGTVFGKETSPTLIHFFKIYWITKNLELLDTVFMVLRHKSRQISFLHVYHHASMLLLSDFGYHRYPWPAISWMLCINSFVHVILYLYYGLTAYSPNSPPPWKKNLTQLQIVQFFVGFVHSGIGYVYHNFCIYGILYGITMTYLFSSFYYQAYVKKARLARVNVDKNKTN